MICKLHSEQYVKYYIRSSLVESIKGNNLSNV